MKKLFIIFIYLLTINSSFAGTSPLWSLGPFFQDGKIVKIPSYNSGPFPNEFLSLKDGSYKKSPVKIDALIVYPKKGKGHFLF